jgi:DNA-binding MarR family transcriptional regulator
MPSRRKRDTRFSSRRQPARYAGAANRKGSENFASKLTERDVTRARQLHKKGTPLHELAERFGVHASTMSRALRRLTFRHVR